ncbi:MAG TPA: hypothetical protein PLZ57_13380 [Pseudobdellovibrionaceae bacterium]|nr:hypothetical protein [Pseudobdellovibrionaceae bacterium]
MRSKELKIVGEKKDAVLVAGGAGFKIYTVSGLNGWALALGRNISFIEEESQQAQTVANYVNLKYQPLNRQEAIKEEFSQLIDSLMQRDLDPSL